MNASRLHQLTLLLVVSLYYTRIVSAVLDDDSYKILDPDEKFRLAWEVDGTKPDSEITFKVRMYMHSVVAL